MKFVMDNSRYGPAEFSWAERSVTVQQEDGKTEFVSQFPSGFMKALIKAFEFRTTVRSYGNKRLSEIVWPAKFYIALKDTIIFHNNPVVYSDGKVSWKKGLERKNFELISFNPNIPICQIQRVYFDDVIEHSMNKEGIFHTTLTIDKVEKVTYKTRNKRSHLPVLTIG